MIKKAFDTPFSNADSYKLAHSEQYPEGTEVVYSNFTARKGRDPQLKGIIFAGLGVFTDQLTEEFERFFSKDEDEAVEEFDNFHHAFMGTTNPRLTERVRQLHKSQELSIEFKSLPEGSFVPYGVPFLTMENTDPSQFWLTNFIETWMSSVIWPICTSATTAFRYRLLFEKYARETSDQDWFVKFQGHDFSSRGMMGLEAGALSGYGHLTSFVGSDALRAFDLAWSHTAVGDLTATSVPATEHSVMCAGGEDNELETIRRIITQVNPSGIVSIVSDTWDFWDTVTRIYKELKPEIMARDGKVVVRPDSSPKTPVEIICGDPDAEVGSPEYKGLIQVLYEIFGGAVNSKGYIELDPHIGAIYGDSITLEYASKILEQLKAKGFASTNIVFGIGSYTYQYVTRDTHGFAMKATQVRINGEDKAIFKDPKTDASGKKSAKGRLAVQIDPVSHEYTLLQDVDLSVDSELKPFNPTLCQLTAARIKVQQEIDATLNGAHSARVGAI